jgi:hypothetical protein
MVNFQLAVKSRLPVGFKLGPPFKAFLHHLEREEPAATQSRGGLFAVNQIFTDVESLYPLPVARRAL